MVEDWQSIISNERIAKMAITPHEGNANKQKNPLVISLLGGYRGPGSNARESTEESMRYPSELFRGFALGTLLGLLPIAAIWLFLEGQAKVPALIQAASQPGMPGFWLFWMVAGLLTAFLVTGGFVLAVWIPARMPLPSPSIQGSGKVIPATGHKEEETGEDKQEE
jgi:hypothetical protein